MNKKYKKIALIMAMEGEAKPIIEHYKLKRIAFHNPIIVYANEDQSLIVSLNGKSKEHGIDNIGTQAATLNAFITISNYQPELIINCGTAGGFKAKGGKIGDTYIATEKICFHDRRIDLPGGFAAYALGNYPVIDSDFLAKKFNLKQGIISSSDALDYTKTDMAIFQKNNASVKEMEAAAIAWVCQMNTQEFTAIKTITDIVDGAHCTSEEFLENFEMASYALKKNMVKIIDFLIQY
ncbi:MAG: 5'-methylthioadenosine nucleosidase [Planctomycetota bacterium]|jgi:5'-methylthioadenosine nucleosidase